MHRKEFRTVIKTDVASLWNFHSSAEALVNLTPPGRKLQIVSTDLTVRENATHEFKVKTGPLWISWCARLTEVSSPHGFRDTALKSPFKAWSHRHDFLPHKEGALLQDVIEYSLPFGTLGVLVNRLFVSRDLDRLFEFRHTQTRRALETV